MEEVYAKLRSKIDENNVGGGFTLETGVGAVGCETSSAKFAGGDRRTEGDPQLIELTP